MTAPPPFNPQIPLTSNADRTSGTTSQRPQQSAWGLNQQHSGVRRVLTPISTSFGQNSGRPTSSAQSPRNVVERNPWSPVGSNSSSLQQTSSRQSIRSPPITSSSSPFTPPLSGQQHAQSTSLLQSSRPRTIASSANPQLASAAAATQASGIGGASGGGSSKNFRASPSLQQSTFSSLTTSSTLGAQSNGQAGQVSKIIIAQIFLLLSTIKEDKDKSKWDLQADQIRKLVDQNGMDVFTKYFRRLLASNAAQIWGAGRSTETTGSYQILVTEVQKITQDLSQAGKIVEAIEFGEGEVFKDFDLSKFMDHFKMSPLAKVTLASAFRKAAKPDLRTKADAILSNNLKTLFHGIADPSSGISPEPPADIAAMFYASLIDRLAQDPPRNWSSDSQQMFFQSFQQRFLPSGALVPLEISSALYLFELLGPSNTLVRLIKRSGPKGTESSESCKSMLDSVDGRDVTNQQVANALLFMVIAGDDPSYDPKTFVATLREHRIGQRLDWQAVVQAFDRDGLQITRNQFKRIFDTLLPVSQAIEEFDIQLLWGGDWHHEETQLAFTAGFVSFSEDELDASQIPRLRKAFTLEDFADAPEDVKTYAETAVRHPLVSVDATKALFNMVFRSSETYMHAQIFGVVDTIINPKMDLFVCSVSAVPKPWSALQDQAIKQLVASFFWKAVTGRAFALHLLWKRDMPWLAQRLLQYYQAKPIQLSQILDLAHEHGWMHELIGTSSDLSLDLAAVAHGRGLFDLEPWLHQMTQSMRKDRLIPGISNFLKTKAEDELKTQREDIEPFTVPLTITTVHALLTFLGNEGLGEEERTLLQRICIQAYPRLINFGEGFDTLIEANSLNGNSLSPDADAKMQEHYKLMYSGEKQVRDVVEDLQAYKTSEDPTEQELFACMIFGLFDEYNCFGEYPLDALATTAVLFGGIINFNLLSRIALQVALSMVLEAVRDYLPHQSMYKFGLQALLHFQDRLEEWLSLSKILVQVPGLQGTPIFPHLEKVLRDAQIVTDGDKNDQDGTNNAVDDFLVPDSKVLDFTCLAVDPPARVDFYKDPDEQVQEVVLFTLNNVSERNLAEKLPGLKKQLVEENYQWFANYLVESRIKPQPNYQQLYMDLLDMFGDDGLSAEVLRESYISAIRMLNSESTMTSSNERTHLKTLGAWLGSMTLARNHAVKFNNISFKDLLVEAHNTHRLLVAIPFTCKVLAMAAKSVVFKLPCVWTMEILEILVELYQFADLKLNLKFEIEVLCKALDVDHKDLEPSTVIRSTPYPEEELTITNLTDPMDGFVDLSLMNFNRARGIVERFSPLSMIPDFAELSSLLKHNYSLPQSTATPHSQIRHALTLAAERAVSEIIGPVVERSVTIAAISASQLVAKDFVLEPDANRYEESAHVTVQKLAGSLAGVTCKEPLRASMQNNIMLMRNEIPEQDLPQGSILMFVNDNIDSVCGIVQRAAENAAIGEIDAQIEDAIQLRKSTNFVEPSVSPWASYIPEPYRPIPGGLNRDQLAIYSEFGRPIRGPVTHNNNISQDSGRQVPDILQDQYTLPRIPTPAEAPMMPLPNHHQPPQNSRTPNPPHSMNGYPTIPAVRTRIVETIQALYLAVRDAEQDGIKGYFLELPSVQDGWLRLRDTIVAAGTVYKDDAAFTSAGEIVRILDSEPVSQQMAAVFTDILAKMCAVSDRTARDVHNWCDRLVSQRPSKTVLVVAALKSDLIKIQRVDQIVASDLQNRDPGAISFLNDIVDGILLNELPSALRADFANSLTELTRWTIDEASGNHEGLELLRKLQDPTVGSSSPINDEAEARDAQFEYIFEEWIRLQSNHVPATTLTTFIHQLHARGILGSREDTALFLRLSIDLSAQSFAYENSKQTCSADEAFLAIDALAKLTVLLATHQGKLNNSRVGKAEYFEELLTLLMLILVQQYDKLKERFNGRLFFRLFSSILHELNSIATVAVTNQRDMLQAFGRILLLIRPQLLPGFAFYWLDLHSHRLFMPALLRSQDELCGLMYCNILEYQMAHIGDLLTPAILPPAMQDLYRSVLRLLLVLHHDYPEFLAENHFQLLRHIPTHCTQMRSLVVSACPSSVHDLPDPFTEGLKVDRIEDMKRPPIVRGDTDSILINADIYTAVDEMLKGSSEATQFDRLVTAISNSAKDQGAAGSSLACTDITLLNALVLYLVKHAEMHTPPTLTFSTSSTYAGLLMGLTEKLNPEGRYQLISAIANQLRYPSTHTHFFMYALFHLFRAGQTDQVSMEIQQEITRVFTERIVVHRPHPWGLMVTLLELIKNRTYRFWDIPFVKESPDLERMLTPLLQQAGAGARIVV